MISGLKVINIGNDCVTSHFCVSSLVKQFQGRYKSYSRVSMSTIKRTFFQKEDHLLRLDAVMRMVARAISEKDPSKICLVDFVPNLKWMLSNPNFVKDCHAEFKEFEEKVIEKCCSVFLSCF